MKKVAIVAGRDFILIFHWCVTPEGVVYISAFSDDREDLVPLNPDLVRGGVAIAGWKVEPLSATHTRITYLTEIDFRGYVPNFVLT